MPNLPPRARTRSRTRIAAAVWRSAANSDTSMARRCALPPSASSRATNQSIKSTSTMLWCDRLIATNASAWVFCFRWTKAIVTIALSASGIKRWRDAIGRKLDAGSSAPCASTMRAIHSACSTVPGSARISTGCCCTRQRCSTSAV